MQLEADKTKIAAALQRKHAAINAIVRDRLDTHVGGLISAGLKHGLLRNQAAYVLATAFWETGRAMKPVREMGGEKYLRSKKYYPYIGMGYVPLTWRENYQKASDKLSVDFVSDPKLLLEPVHATEILNRYCRS